MSRFFITETDTLAEQIVLRGENYHHLTHVLRAAVGEKVCVCDGAGTEYECTLSAVDGQNAYLTIDQKHDALGESKLDITGFQCLAKGEKMEQIITRCVEMGVHRIVPVYSRFCIAKPTGASKTMRYKKIALSAAKQSGRAIVPEIGDTIDFQEAVQRLCAFQNGFVCYEKETEYSLLEMEACGTQIGFLIGSEGGFSAEEAACWRAAGLRSVSLGPRILRTENAAAFVLPILYSKYGTF